MQHLLYICPSSGYEWHLRTPTLERDSHSSDIDSVYFYRIYIRLHPVNFDVACLLHTDLIWCGWICFLFICLCIFYWHDPVPCNVKMLVCIYGLTCSTLRVRFNEWYLVHNDKDWVLSGTALSALVQHQFILLSLWLTSDEWLLLQLIRL